MANDTGLSVFPFSLYFPFYTSPFLSLPLCLFNSSLYFSTFFLKYIPQSFLSLSSFSIDFLFSISFSFPFQLFFDYVSDFSSLFSSFSLIFSLIFILSLFFFLYNTFFFIMTISLISSNFHSVSCFLNLSSLILALSNISSFK